MNEIERFKELVENSDNIVFLAVREYRPRAASRILEA